MQHSEQFNENMQQGALTSPLYSESDRLESEQGNQLW
jgi:hypothetical protein